MHPQLREIVAAFEAASTRLHRLASASTAEEWRRRPASGGWSAAECVAHLNLTAEAFLPALLEGIDRARVLGGGAPPRLRRDLIGWLLSRALAPGGRLRTTTGPAFVPTDGLEKELLVPGFDRLQAEQIACVESAEGLPIQRVRIPSPFDARVKYSVYSALVILPIHQQRHLAQAEAASGTFSG